MLVMGLFVCLALGRMSEGQKLEEGILGRRAGVKLGWPWEGEGITPGK